jgi:hypothetical protein
MGPFVASEVGEVLVRLERSLLLRGSAPERRSGAQSGTPHLNPPSEHAEGEP